jgi:hypothetical protein
VIVSAACTAGIAVSNKPATPAAAIEAKRAALWESHLSVFCEFKVLPLPFSTCDPIWAVINLKSRWCKAQHFFEIFRKVSKCFEIWVTLP